jgi:hypothetical protein
MQRVGSSLLTATMICACAVAAPVARGEAAGPSASPEELRQANIRTVSALKDQPELPDAIASPPKCQALPRWSSNEENRRLLVSAKLNYQGLTNSYCRLFTLPAGLRSAELVALPSRANSEDCLGITTVLYPDLNGDGVADVVQGLRLKSNRYEASAVVPVVHLSSADAKSGYCYSEQASRPLSPDGVRSAEATRDALASARRRLGIPHFDCAQ